ncbi:hypothetical protein [Polaribacter sp.]|jgi:hypothetical protein|uniref:hypothetical protein n=1 Tax=Polaribacter sp. TaxID=1920175 RepID=UPI003AD3DA56
MLKIASTVNDAIVGDKNVYITKEDLVKWTQELNSGNLLSKESLALMFIQGETIYSRKVLYGFRIDTKEINSIYHYGKWNGFRTGFKTYLEDDLVVIVQEHTSANALKSLIRRIKNIVIKNFDI